MSPRVVPGASTKSKASSGSSLFSLILVNTLLSLNLDVSCKVSNAPRIAVATP